MHPILRLHVKQQMTTWSGILWPVMPRGRPTEYLLFPPDLMNTWSGILWLVMARGRPTEYLLFPPDLLPLGSRGRTSKAMLQFGRATVACREAGG